MVKRMSRRRFENLDPERQRKLFDSAAEEFAASGYDAASLNRIIERAGMSKSSLYYYFDDKADFFAVLMERAFGFLLKRIGGLDLEALTAETYWSTFEDALHRLVALASEDSWPMKLARAFYWLRGNPKHTASTEKTFTLVRRWMAQALERGQDLGVVRKDLPNSLMTDIVMGLGEALDRWTIAHWDSLDEEARHRLVGDQLDLFRRMLKP